MDGRPAQHDGHPRLRLHGRPVAPGDGTARAGCAGGGALDSGSLPEGSGLSSASLSGVASTVGPLLLTAAATAFSFSEELIALGTAAAWVGTSIAFVVNLPVMTLLWVLVAILRGFARFGTLPLRLDEQFGNPSLGLALVGLLAFNGFVAFLAVLLPFLLVRVQRPRDLAVAIAFAIAPAVLEFLSLYRLHLQMVEARSPLRHVGARPVHRGTQSRASAAAS